MAAMHMLSLYTAGEQIKYVYSPSGQHKVNRTKTDRRQTIVINQLFKEENKNTVTEGKGKAEHLYSALHGIQTTLKRLGIDHTVSCN